MKIVIRQKDNPQTGKGYFIQRLVPAMQSLGVEVTNDLRAKADIALHVGRVHFKSRARRNIIRVGPACADTNKNHKAINKAKRKSVKQCDAVIYQSKFSKKVYHNLVYKPSVPETVILNGAPLTKAQCSDAHFNILACTRRWWPQKRLNDIFTMVRMSEIPNIMVYVAGDISMTKYKNSLPMANVKWLGILNQERLAYYRKLCHVHVHITWLDACPNSVVESLTAGLPVICSNQGGTHEIVEKDTSGASSIVNCDHNWRFSPSNLNTVGKAASKLFIPKLKEHAKERKRAYAPELDINVIAKQYVDFFEKCLK